MQSRFADWLVKVLTNNKDLAGRLVIEITQKDVRAFSPIDFDLLHTLADLGFRMSVTQLTDARSDLFELSRYGFRYAKAPVGLFLGSDAETKSDIHPEDLSDLAARNGMDLIVDQVESESQMVELLDFKLKYGQGNLFARPRAVDVEPHPLLDQSDATEDDGAHDEPDPSQDLPPQPQRSARALSRSA
jgi:cyclic-di-GMP phosphodiesterase TipF (flagellum assembly factor)